MRFSILLIICSISFLNTWSQEESNWNLYEPSSAQNETNGRDNNPSADKATRDSTKKLKGEIRYIQEERISILDDYMRSNPIKHDGFRIQLKTGSRSEVASARSVFLSRWSYSAYEDYLAPNFRLRVGDFMTRFQAEKALHELKSKFPTAYIVSDKIEVPKRFR